MQKHGIPDWLRWAREIQAIAQSGNAFSQSEYDRERYARLTEIAAEIVNRHTDIPVADLTDALSHQVGYATPKIDVRGAIIRDDRILLVQERSDRLWTMPGGWADVGETPSDMVAREVFEESGFKARVQKVIGVYDANEDGIPQEFYHAYKIVFLCDITGGSAQVSNETMAVDFFSFDDLPPLSPNRTSQRHINDVMAHIRDKGRNTDFD